MLTLLPNQTSYKIEAGDSLVFVGVLALQGDFEAHGAKLSSYGVAWQAVRTATELESVSGLILPGGESTSLWTLMENNGIDNAIVALAQRGIPILATCSGSIMLSKQILNPVRKGLGIIDADIIRNAYGRQIKSSIVSLTKIRKDIFGDKPLEAVFIRAPKFVEVGANCEILAWYGDNPVCLRCGNILALTFHPELSHDDRIFNLFLKTVEHCNHSKMTDSNI